MSRFRSKLFAIAASAAVFGLLAIMSRPAQAGTFGPGNTVQPEYWTGSISGQPEFEDWCSSNALGTGTVETPATVSMCPSGSFTIGLPAPMTTATGAVQYIQGALSGSTVLMGDTTITITNQLANTPFCSLAGIGTGTGIGTMCADAFDGFDFLYTGSVDITGVSVDMTNSALDFRPTTATADNGNTHLGLQLINGQDVRVDLTGAEPAIGDNLVIDLTFGSPPPPVSTPEPASMLLLGAGMVGLAAVRRR